MKYGLIVIFCCVWLACQKNNQVEVPAKSGEMQLPDGFRFSVYADQVENARSLSLAPDGTLFVGTRTAGNVYALRDTTHDGVADVRWTIASGLNMPNGVAFKDGSLFVAEIDNLWRYDNILQDLTHPPKPKLLHTFPDDPWHGWKFIRFGPDGKLYVPVGAPCNVCNPESPFSRIHRINPDGSGLETVVEGMRNTVGFDWHPQSGELYFTDNGRDMLGDELPNDELNRISKPMEHFGFPYFHAGDIADPDFGRGKKASDYTPPIQKLGAHVAAIGMRFYTGKRFPDTFRNRVFIAEHGSWNSSVKVGYKISTVDLTEKDSQKRYQPFLEGFLQRDEQGNEAVSGRPVDIEITPDGSLLVSDDFANKIYRITYQNPNP